MVRRSKHAVSFYAFACVLFTYGSQVCDSKPKYDAWKVLVNFAMGYIKYTNYNDSNRICMGVSTVILNETYRTAVFNFTLRTTDDPAIQTIAQYGKVGRRRNIVQFYDAESGDLAVEFEVPYSNYTTCTILKQVNSTKCRLRTSDEASEAEIDKCLTKFYPYCGTTIYDVYNEQLCPA
ncbi:uncharacterized protein ISCGN_018215 [Ixodes scapularis]